MTERRSWLVVRRALAVTAVGLGCLGLPAAAPAQARPPRAIQITFPGTHGYGIEVSGNVEGTHSTVTVSAGKPFSGAKYSVRGTITPDRVHASFGPLGAVSLHLTHYRVEQVKLSKSCRLPGAPAVSEVRLGTFVGRVRFHGENDYTSGSARRVKGAVGEPTAILVTTGPDRHAKLFCLAGPGYESGKAKAHGPPVLQATSADCALSFLAMSDTASVPVGDAYAGSDDAPVPNPTTFIATDSESRGAIQISRSAITSGPAGDFAYDNALGTATVMPPAPFAGTAGFRRNADGSTVWAGSLAVSFPGMPEVPLAAPGFAASLGTGLGTAEGPCSQLPGDRPSSSAGSDRLGRLPFRIGNAD